MNTLQLAFAGTPDFAATILGGLISSPHEVGLVISQPDPRKGRGRKTITTPVAELARSHHLLLRQPARIPKTSDKFPPGTPLTAAPYGQILRPNPLNATRRGPGNAH